MLLIRHLRIVACYFLLRSRCTRPSLMRPLSHPCAPSMLPLIHPSVHHSQPVCLFYRSPPLPLYPLSPRTTVTTPLPPQRPAPPSTTRLTRNYTSHTPPPAPPQRALSLTLDTHRQDNFLSLLPWRLSGVQSVMMPHPSARSRLSLQETVQPSK